MHKALLNRCCHRLIQFRWHRESESNMWSVLNKPIPGTPTLSPTKFAAFLGVISVLPGLSEAILCAVVIGWSLAWAFRILPTHKSPATPQRVHSAEIPSSAVMISEL